jgi:hypothetical protein
VDAHIEALGVYGVQGWSPRITVKPGDTALGGISEGSELREAWERRKQLRIEAQYHNIALDSP